MSVLTNNEPQNIMSWVLAQIFNMPYFPNYVSTNMPTAGDWYTVRGTRAVFVRDTGKPAWATASGWKYADGTSV